MAPLVVALITLTLTACSGDDSTNTGPADTTDQNGTTVGSEPPDADIPATETPASATPATETTGPDNTDTTPPTDGAAPESAPVTTDAPAPSALDSFAPIIGLSAPFTRAGDRPTFSWDTVAGAASYDLWVLNSDGTLYWAWSGAEATIPLGGLPALTPDAEGPDVAIGMRWTVSAVDADGVLIAFGAADLIPE